MIDLVLGFVVGIIVGHYVPTLFTKAIAFIKSKSSTVGKAVDVVDTAVTNVTSK